ncbi:GNAT family N-acetyltransferase [Mesonia sediminis]|uniref:GNAT family N-acetyltransferase n=1 Tax=Mesonia sediminis TaxID=1703946 RepID=A0ABW5SF37_9FLAO
METSIRRATKEDMGSVLRLINELAAHEKKPNAVILTEEQLKKDGFGDQKMFTCFLAEADDQVVGMALVYYRYSTWKGKTVHLEDLIVNENYRGKGIGMLLYKQVMRFALDQGVKRVEWVVGDYNTNALEFYKSTGASIMTEWNTVQFDEKSIKNFLAK